MNRNRTHARIARFAIPLALVAVLGAGCAAGTTAAGPGAQAPRDTTVPVTLADKGQLVAVHVGQVIQVSLGAPADGGPWQVATYPRSMLAITSSDPERGLFTFQARSKGQGLVGFTLRGLCGPPLLEAMPDGALCPEAGGPAGGKSVKGVQPGAPAQVTLVTYTFRVS